MVRKLTLFFILLLFLTGCGSMYARGNNYPGVYRGVKEDMNSITGPSFDIELPGIFKIIPLVDLPFSFALDTILLPVDLMQGKGDKKGLEANKTEENKTQESPGRDEFESSSINWDR